MNSSSQSNGRRTRKTRFWRLTSEARTAARHGFGGEFTIIPLVHYTGARRGELTAILPRRRTICRSPPSAWKRWQRSMANLTVRTMERSGYGVKTPSTTDSFPVAHLPLTSSMRPLVRAINERKLAVRSKGERSDAEEEEYIFLSQRGSQYLLAAAIADVQEIVLGQAVTDQFQLSFGSEVSPAVATELRTPLIESLVSFHSSLQGAAEGRGRSVLRSVQGGPGELPSAGERSEKPARARVCRLPPARDRVCTDQLMRLFALEWGGA